MLEKYDKNLSEKFIFLRRGRGPIMSIPMLYTRVGPNPDIWQVDIYLCSFLHCSVLRKLSHRLITNTTTVRLGLKDLSCIVNVAWSTFAIEEHLKY